MGSCAGATLLFQRLVHVADDASRVKFRSDAAVYVHIQTKMAIIAR